MGWLPAPSCTPLACTVSGVASGSRNVVSFHQGIVANGIPLSSTRVGAPLLSFYREPIIRWYNRLSNRSHDLHSRGMTPATLRQRSNTTTATTASATALLDAGFARLSGHQQISVPILKGLSSYLRGINTKEYCTHPARRQQQSPSATHASLLTSPNQHNRHSAPRWSTLKGTLGGSTLHWKNTLRGRRHARRSGCPQGPRAEIQNRELLVGDILALVCFCLYKQITAIILLPHFPGLLAPLTFNPLRFAEFASFSATVVGTWVGVSLLVGGYKTNSTADLGTAASKTCLTWLLAMPVAAAQLVLVTAIEDKVLVGAEGFAYVLPLAATGPGEPLVTAAGILGVMAVWRTFYTAYLDIWNFRTSWGGRIDRDRNVGVLNEALRASVLLSISFCIAVELLFHSIDEATVEQFLSSLWK